MNLSVPCTFEPNLIPQLAAFSQVKEIYGKLHRDPVGGGRSSYSFRHLSWHDVRRTVNEAHQHHITFNYLLNAASLDGMELTRTGQRAIRRLLDRLSEMQVDAVTVSLPYLLRLIKSRYPHFKVRIGVFAMIDSAIKARQWEDLGGDTLCISSIGCNRDFSRLKSIRQSTRCTLELIANAACFPGCAYELTHMNLLTNSSRSGHRLKGYCLDYCFLNCSSRRMREPEALLHGVWIRPEDLPRYEELGYDWFKLVERSCPTELLIKRVAAYCAGKFEGNLWELIGPVAQISGKLGASWTRQARLFWTMIRPLHIRIKSLLLMKKYVDAAITKSFVPSNPPVYIDNSALDGFLQDLINRGCTGTECAECNVCALWAKKAVRIDPGYQKELLAMAEKLDRGLLDGGHWFGGNGLSE